MTTPATELLDQLDALHAAGTPRPWDAEICEGELTVSAGSARTTWEEHDGFRLGTAPASYRATDRIYEYDLDDWDGGQTPDDIQREADADLIVAAVNALPQLTAALRSVLELHDPIDMQGTTFCNEDGHVWPCLTHRHLTAALAGTRGSDV